MFTTAPCYYTCNHRIYRDVHYSSKASSTLVVQSWAKTNVLLSKRGGKAWKEDFFVNAPSWVLLIMRNNFRTPLGGLAVLGLFGMPLWLCSLKFLFNTWFSSPIFGAVFTLGRFVALLVEMWILIKHVRSLAQADRESGCYA